MYKLFYYPNNASLVVHFLLKEMNVSYELVLVDRKCNAQKSKEYLALNPTGRIPTLLDDELVIFESAAICLHLCEQNTDKHLMPLVTSANRAPFLQWLMYLTNTVQPALLVYFYPEKHTVNADELLNATELKSIIRAQEIRIGEMFELLDNQLIGRDYLIGDELSICDFYLLMLSIWADEFTKQPLDYTHLGAYLRRLTQLPSVIAVCEVEKISLTRYL